ncbi:MAG: alkaline phosphatase family protein [Pseudanabaenaceae cyanobacterium bins.68]|nr:alkaline phosphatase family protein [Pseudanabaenaceae cyanobacterium bins.68]
MAPKVILVSLDGCTEQILERFLSDGTLNPSTGLGLLRSKGTVAMGNQTITPSLTAPAHIAIATGSNAARNEINANTFHLVAAPFNSNTSGFAAPIGGYSFGQDGPRESTDPTARPVWVDLRAAGKRVVTATFPGGDGATITLPGNNNVVLQSSNIRTVDYTVPFGAFGGLGTRGFTLQRADFTPASTALTSQFAAAGRQSNSPILVANLETIPATGTGSLTGGSRNPYTMQIAAFDTTADGVANYDSVAVFDAGQPIPVGVQSLPSTGPAYLRANSKTSQRFYFEGSNNRAGTGFYLSNLAPDLNNTRLIRYAVNFIPRNAPALSAVDDINNNVGFWSPQPDFRLTQRSAPGLANYPEIELEEAYADLVKISEDYTSNLVGRAIQQNPNADLVMTYFEQPDGSEHQFLLTDPRQASNPLDANTIGANQDQAKIARYQEYIKVAYRGANDAIQKIIDQVGVDANGVPRSNIIVVSDHGFAPFHTVVNPAAFLQANGFDPAQVRAVSSGPAVNFYINLQGRESNGTVSVAEYISLQQRLVNAVRNFNETNPTYTRGAASVPIFDQVYVRPVAANATVRDIIQARTEFISQDSGDVFALLSLGYNFDAVQTPPVIRVGDQAATNPVLSVPPFYGAHGYDPTKPEMQAVFYAAGPNINQGRVPLVKSIDVAPTISQILGVPATRTAQGQVIPGLLRNLTANNPGFTLAQTMTDTLPMVVMLGILLVIGLVRVVRRVKLALAQTGEKLTLANLMKAVKKQLRLRL